MRFWYKPLPFYLKPLRLPAWLFGKVANRRYQQFSNLKKFPNQPPVIVVGNIVVGGAGKSPLVHSIVQYFIDHGKKVVIISRGYGGKSSKYPVVVDAHTRHSEVGDEAIMHFRRGFNIVCDPNRKRAYLKAVECYDPDVIVSDDGLQHYKLPRDIEIAVLDAKRLFGNGYFIPAGPMRDGVARWQDVDMRVLSATDISDKDELRSFDAYYSLLKPVGIFKAIDHKAVKANELKDKPLKVAAAIANPERVVTTIEEEMGITVSALHAFQDHKNIDTQLFADKDVNWIITEKDVARFDFNEQFSPKNVYFIKVDAQLSADFFNEIEALLKRA